MKAVGAAALGVGVGCPKAEGAVLNADTAADGAAGAKADEVLVPNELGCEVCPKAEGVGVVPNADLVGVAAGAAAVFVPKADVFGACPKAPNEETCPKALDPDVEPNAEGWDDGFIAPGCAVCPNEACPKADG